MAHRQLKIFCWNASSLQANIGEFRDNVTSNDYDIILVQETKAPNINRIKIRNYNCFLTPRTPIASPIAGGTCVYVKRRIKHALLPSLPTQTIDNTIVRIFISPTESFTICSIYVRQHHQPNDVINDLTQFLNVDTKLILAGDFNAHHPRWQRRNPNINSYGRALNTFIFNNDFDIAFPPTPTRFDPNTGNGNTLDFALLHEISYPYTVVSPAELSSDHNPVIITLTTQVLLPPHLTHPSIDWVSYTNEIFNSPAPFTSIDSREQIPNAVASMTHIIQNAISSSKIHPPEGQFSPLPLHIKRLIKKKNNLRKLWQQNRHPALKQQYNRQTTIVKNAINRWRCDTWSSYLDSLSEDDKTFWSFIRRKTRPFTVLPSLRTVNGDAITDGEKSEALADAYKMQFTPNPDVFCPMTIDHVYDSISDFYRIPVTTPIPPTSPEEIVKIICDLPTRKAPGLDQITNTALKNLPSNFAHFIAVLINAIFKFRSFPHMWKEAIIIPIHKSGTDPHIPSNYRPISLLTSLSKVAEHVICNRLNNFLTTNSIIIPQQFGFRPKLSTTHQLLRVTEFISEGFSEGMKTGAIFLDCSRAFDRLWVSGLIFKLIRLKIPSALIQLIHSYLRSRSFRVRINTSTLSNSTPIQAGVPQGSKLGPILFNLFVNDIPLGFQTTLALFADDTAIIARNHNALYMQKALQRHILLLEKWFSRWRVKLNTNKTQAVFFSFQHTPPPPVTLYGQPIPFGSEAKYLGVTLDSRLTFRPHIENVVRKYYFKRSKINFLLHSQIDLPCKLKLFKSFLRPTLLYAFPTFGFAANTNIDRLQTTQNKTLRTIHKAHRYMSNRTVHNDLKIKPIRSVAKKQAIKFFGKIPTNPNPLVVDLPVYDPARFHRRPRAVLQIFEGINKKDPLWD